MITQIDICNTATFGNTPTTIDGLKKLNFFFGTNGVGKTTISKVIADSTQYPSCNLTWENGFELAARVYNRDFVEKNFKQQIKGVFTLGEQEVDTLTKIATTKDGIKKLNEDIVSLTNTLNGEDGESGKTHKLEQLEDTFANKCWTIEQKYKEKFSGGFHGYMGSKKSFKNKVLQELSNTADLLPLKELEERAATIYSGVLTTVQAIDLIHPQKILLLEKAPILRKCVIGKDDVDIAAIIKKLNNSDWVRQGLSYYKANDGICPFCQQTTDDSLMQSLNEYFDETFEQDNMAIKTLIRDYSVESSLIQQAVQTLIDLSSEFVDREKLETEKKLLDSKIAINSQRLEQKRKEPSQVIELDTLKNVLDTIIALIVAANIKIDERNTIVNNITREKINLTKQIWRYVIEELQSVISEYKSQANALSAAITNLHAQLKTKNDEKQLKEVALKELEKKSTSTQPTIDDINNRLASFGFTSFKLDRGFDERTYKLVRANGSDAQETLSEGERNFVTFLYFYHLLKGSHEESGVTVDKVVVFDDPVSSLDSDILFVVSSMIRELYEDLLNNKGTIKQLFILTHNVYFHKEVSYDYKREKDKTRKDESFWLIKKRGDHSLTERQTSNPIKTSYELLWQEVKASPEQRNNATIQNTLRRILESYFKLLGGIPLDELYTKFDGDDKIKCKDLCSWVNDGSHSGGLFSDEYYTMPDDTVVEKYLQVFKKIFEQCKHTAHYAMMMGTSYEQKSMEDTSNDQA